MESIRVNENMNVLIDAHLRNASKTPQSRQADYVDAIQIVGESVVDEIEEKIRTKMLEITNHNPKLIRKAFDHFDCDKNGNIDIREFDRALKKLGIQLKEMEVFALYGRYDINFEGAIRYPLFSQGVVRGRTPKKKSRGETFTFDECHEDDFKQADESDEEADRAELKEIMESW